MTEKPIIDADTLRSKIKELANNYKTDPQQLAEYLNFKSRFHKYSFNNTMLMLSQNPGARFVGSFKDFKDKGYSVNKGEHGMKILVPTPITFFRENENAEWKRLIDATKEQREKVIAGIYESYKKLHFSVGTVFDIAQTNCPKEEYPAFLGIGHTSSEHHLIFQALSDYSWKTLNCPVDVKDLKSVSLRGYFIPVLNKIEINSIFDDTTRLSILSHELGHAIIHNGNVNMPESQIEFEADAFSIMLDSSFGIDIVNTRKNHLASVYNNFKNCTDEKVFDNEIEKSLDRVSEHFNKHITEIEKSISNYQNNTLTLFNDENIITISDNISNCRNELQSLSPAAAIICLKVIASDDLLYAAINKSNIDPQYKKMLITELQKRKINMESVDINAFIH